MRVTKKDGCLILRASGGEVPYEGEVSLSAFKRAIRAEAGEKCETLEGGCLVIDEEGKLKHKPILNPKATRMYKYSFITVHGALQMVDYIAGDVVYIPKEIRQRWDEEEQMLLALEDDSPNF